MITFRERHQYSQKGERKWIENSPTPQYLTAIQAEDFLPIKINTNEPNPFEILKMYS